MKKKLHVLMLFLISGNPLFAQLTGITPNQGVPGQIILSTTITASGVFLQCSSPSCNVCSVSLKNTGYIIPLPIWFVNTYPDSMVISNFTIPLTAIPGNYDLVVEYNLDTMGWTTCYLSDTLYSCFFLPQADGYIKGTVFLDSNENGIRDSGETGLANEIIKINPPNYNIYADSAGNYSFPVFNGNYTISWQAKPGAYMVRSSDSASYSIQVNNDTVTGRDFGLLYAIESATPNVVLPGQSVAFIIKSRGTFINYIAYFLLEPMTGGSTILTLTFTYVNNDTVIAYFNIPQNAATGNYRLWVKNMFGYYQNGYLPDAVTISNGDGAISGTIYLDSNENGVKDAGEIPMPNEAIKVMPGNYSFLSDSSGNYSIPLFNGTNTVSWEFNNWAYLLRTSDSASFTATVNNDTISGNDFGLIYSIVSITPNQAVRGQMITALIVSRSTFYPSITEIYLQHMNGGSLFYSVAAHQINVDSVVATFNLPKNMPTGSYKIWVRTYPIGWVKCHYLPDAFTVFQEDGAVSGSVYRDKNLNGVRDSGETGLPNQQISMMPENVFTVTDTSGNYFLPALNGNHDISYKTDSTNFYMVTSLPSVYSVAVNNDSLPGNDFGIMNGLLSVTPVEGHQGETLNVVISSNALFDTTGGQQGNIDSLYLKKGAYTISAATSSISVIDSNTATATFIIPVSAAYIGSYELYTVINNYSMTQRLLNAFTVAPFPYSASGEIYYDVNSNGVKDSGEANLFGERVLLSPNTIYYYSDYSGIYAAGFATGSYNVEWSPPPGSTFNLSSDSSLYHVSGSANIAGLDFGLVTTNPPYSADIDYASGFPRCFQNVTYTISYKNTGPLVVTDGKIYFKKASAMTYVSSSLTPSQFSGDTIVWNYSNLSPFSLHQITVTFTMPAAGNVLHTYAAILPFDGTSYLLKDSRSMTQTVQCSYDPNDKSVIPEGVHPPHYVLMADTLEYLIRFQNTGNDTAFNITIIDYLSNGLDFNSFAVVASSHSVNTELKSDGQLKFTFNNILLPDSNINEPASHGFVSFRINAKTNIQDVTPVTNNAFIIFDSNPPVVTNTTLNTFVFSIPVNAIEEIKRKGKPVLYPNPFDDFSILVFANDFRDTYYLTVTDIKGVSLMKQTNLSDRFIIDGNNFKPGLYFYRLINKNKGLEWNGKFIVR